MNFTFQVVGGRERPFILGTHPIFVPSGSSGGWEGKTFHLGNAPNFAFLDTFSVHRFSRTCVVILVDRTEVALAATEWRLGLELSAWSVPTPPVASYSSASVSSDDD